MDTQNNVPEGSGSTTTTGETTPTGKKKKREASATGSGKVCPEDFVKVSEFLCLHYNEEERTFAGSKEYCKNLNEKARLMVFANAANALKVWKLGKGKYYWICNNLLVYLYCKASI